MKIAFAFIAIVVGLVLAFMISQCCPLTVLMLLTGWHGDERRGGTGGGPSELK